MEPADGRAQRVAQFFSTRLERATAHTWDTPGQVLAIDNRRVLHARGDATNEPNRAIERLALLMNEWPDGSTPPRRKIPLP
ncbi:TauD/TfdA family dioxygenase [Gordonia sp. CNJ-863]|uniref:TauD/TfdA family dioxygenase n=1 Tax=Gordonia sp. CNJ-863 TaxID=1904963 RepID=UPI00096A56EA|nr:TauD/TfdA family dioxygenase [Gordonia sp. CNJ-863]